MVRSLNHKTKGQSPKTLPLHLIGNVDAKDSKSCGQSGTYNFRHGDQYSASHNIFLSENAMVVIKPAKGSRKRKSVLRQVGGLRRLTTLYYHIIELLRQH